MQTAQELFFKVQEAKKRQRELRATYREALKNSADHQEAVEQIKLLKEKKHLAEQKVRGEFSKEFDLLDGIAQELKKDEERITDLVLLSLAKGEAVKVLDAKNNTYDPVIKVVFKKSDEH